MDYPKWPAFKIGVPTGIRTPVLTVKGWCPRPLDDGDNRLNLSIVHLSLVEPGGIERQCASQPGERFGFPQNGQRGVDGRRDRSAAHRPANGLREFAERDTFGRRHP